MGKSLIDLSFEANNPMFVGSKEDNLTVFIILLCKKFQLSDFVDQVLDLIAIKLLLVYHRIHVS